MDLEGHYDIPSDLQNTIYLDQGAINRISNKPLHTSSKSVEFLYIIEKVTKEAFDETEWEAEDRGQGKEDDDDDDEGNVCICSQPIHQLHYITHIPTRYTFKVGCECVKKVSKKLYYHLTKDKCKRCENPLMDRRRIPEKNGYCSELCYHICEYRLSFGKHKGSLLYKAPNEYIRWLDEDGRKYFGKNYKFWRVFDLLFAWE